MQDHERELLEDAIRTAIDSERRCVLLSKVIAILSCVIIGIGIIWIVA